jgi:hypothetical protein
MRCWAVPFRIQHLAPDGSIRTDVLVDLPVVHAGGGEGDDVHIEGLSPFALRLELDGATAILAVGGKRVRLEQRWTTLEVGMAIVRIGVYPRVGKAVRGGCPRCGGSLSEQHEGGPYRAVARREMTCEACELSVLELVDAAAAVGAFSQERQGLWVHVAAPMSCPTCLRPMQRWILTTNKGQAEVERCVPCAVVVLDEDDRSRLSGG